MLPETIKTKRLLLRPYRTTDIDDVFAYAADPEWGRFLPVPHPYEYHHAVEFIDGALEIDWQANPMWAIALNDVAIGGINLRLDLLNQVAEMGYSVARDYWGHGFTSEVAQKLIDIAFTEITELNRIRAMADSRNGASLRIMEKMGMVREGCLRQNRKWRGEFIDEVWCGILRPEWEALQSD